MRNENIVASGIYYYDEEYVFARRSLARLT